MNAQKKGPDSGRGLGYCGPGKGLKHWITNASGLIVEEFLDKNQADFTVYEVLVLRFVKTRTLKWGKQAERIPFRHFVDGVMTDDGVRICSGLPMAAGTIRKALGSLVEKGWITRTVSARRDGGDDAYEYGLAIRKFEIDNIKEVQETAIRSAAAIQVSGISLLHYVSLSARAAKAHADATNKQVFQLLQSRTEEENMHLRIPKNKASTRVHDVERGDSTTCSPKSKYFVFPVNKEEERTDVLLSTASRSRTRVQRKSEIDFKPEESAMEAVTRVLRRSDAKRTALATKGATAGALLSKAQVQAILDEATAAAPGNLPRTLITDKAFGMLKKRAKEQAIADLRDFLRFVLGHWPDLAHRYNFGLKAARKNGMTVAQKDLTETPDAWAIATKLSWFARHYASHLAGTYVNAQRAVVENRESDLQARIQKLERNNAALREERQGLLTKARRRAAPAKTYSAFAEDTRFDKE